MTEHLSTSKCPFCEIAAGRAPATIHADVRSVEGRVLLIEPLNPVTPGHMLAIPSVHVENASEDKEVAGFTFKAAAHFAKPPCNLITSCGAEATQTIRHLHVHVVPRTADDGLALPWTEQTGCVGCERYRAGITQISSDYEAEIERLQAALREAWADG